MPRRLQSKIHSEKSTVAQIWTDYKQQIIDLSNASQSKADFNDHLIREFNRKINRFNKSSDLFITPFDAGFRFTANSISQVNLLNGLYAHWELNELSGNRLDATGNSLNTLYPAGSPSFGVTGKIGNAVELLGGMSLDASVNFPINNGFSISLWLDGTPTENGCAAAQWQVGYGFFIGLVNNYATGNDFLFNLGPLGQLQYPRSTTGFQHLVGTFDPIAQVAKLYIDGVLRVTVSNTTPPAFNTEVPFQIGGLDGSTEFAQIGLVDLTSIWGRPITQAEVTRLYNGGLGRTYANF